MAGQGLLELNFSDPPLRKLLKDWDHFNNRAWPNTLKKVLAMGVLVVVILTMYLCVLGHAFLLLSVWYKVVTRGPFQISSKNIVNFVDWVQFCVYLGFICYLLIFAAISAAQWRGILRHYDFLQHRPFSLKFVALCWILITPMLSSITRPNHYVIHSLILQVGLNLNRLMLIIYVSVLTCLVLATVTSDITRTVIQSRRNVTLQNEEWQLSPLEMINPMILAREVKFKIKHKMKLGNTAAASLTKVEAISASLDYIGERTGYYPYRTLYQKQIIILGFLAMLESEDPTSTRPSRQFAAFAPEHHQNPKSGRWERHSADADNSNKDATPSARSRLQYFYPGFLAVDTIYNELIVPAQRVGRLFHNKCQSPPPETAWVAFSIFNLLTAVVYYLCVFDGTGTVNPSWTGVFG